MTRGWRCSQPGLPCLRGAMIVGVSVARLRHERRHFELEGKVQGLVFQFLIGIGKLRVAAGIDRALTVWARKFAEQKRQFIASRRAENWLSVFDAAFPVLATLIIFAYAWEGGGSGTALNTGQFLAFYAAFGQTLAAGSEFAAAIADALIVLPRWDRLRPLLTETSEVGEYGNDPGQLSGAFELGQVTFRYLPGGPPILNKVTIRVRAGEYVALVGPSGSGKSTIYRLLLGFEKPELGAVFFDGKALDTLDLGGGPPADRRRAAKRKARDRQPVRKYLRRTAADAGPGMASRPARRIGRGYRGDANGHAHRHRRRHEHAFRRTTTTADDRPRAGSRTQAASVRRSDEFPR